MSQLAELKGKQNNSLLNKSGHKYGYTLLFMWEYFDAKDQTESSKIFFAHRPLRQNSWDAQSSLSGSLRALSVDSGSVMSRLTDQSSQNTESDEVGWSSENSNTDEEDGFGDIPGPAPVSLDFFVSRNIGFINFVYSDY